MASTALGEYRSTVLAPDSDEMVERGAALARPRPVDRRGVGSGRAQRVGGQETSAHRLGGGEVVEHGRRRARGQSREVHGRLGAGRDASERRAGQAGVGHPLGRHHREQTLRAGAGGEPPHDVDDQVGATGRVQAHVTTSAHGDESQVGPDVTGTVGVGRRCRWPRLARRPHGHEAGRGHVGVRDGHRDGRRPAGHSPDTGHMQIKGVAPQERRRLATEARAGVEGASGRGRGLEAPIGRRRRVVK